MKIKSELLAPAKDKETAFAAIDCGADAVYIGATSFGARRNAPNSLEDIQEVVNYAHKFWAKVFVTVNTILDDKELEDAVELVKQLDKIGVDAVIVQDMGLIERIKEENIKIPLHISTQCDNRDVEKVSFFNQLGVSRVVLARELSLEKINEIHNTNPNLELEAFIHGALCVSYSGQCYLSQYIGGRSANRGECAQPCRRKYTVETTDGKVIAKDIYALCLKDFNASKYIEKMLNAGVFSFKIEGRLKEIGYVKNITAFYRNELDKYSQKISSGTPLFCKRSNHGVNSVNTIYPPYAMRTSGDVNPTASIYPFEPNPDKTFNRGFTDYFLESRKDCFNFISPKSRGEFIGKVQDIKNGVLIIKTKQIIHPQDGLVYENDGFLVNKVEYGNKKGFAMIYPNKKLELKIGTLIFRNSDTEFNKLLELPVKRQIGVKISINDAITIEDEDGVIIQANFPSDEIAKNKEKMKEIFIKQFCKTGESDFYIEDLQIYSDIPFMPISEINQLRRTLLKQLMDKRLSLYKREPIKQIKYTQFYKHEADYRANVHNKKAKEFYEKCGCKILEPSLEKALPKRQVELMRTKHCIKYALNMCKSSDKLILKDESGNKFPLSFDCKNCEMSVLSEL